jgi:hypothetical protein
VPSAHHRSSNGIRPSQSPTASRKHPTLSTFLSLSSITLPHETQQTSATHRSKYQSHPAPHPIPLLPSDSVDIPTGVTSALTKSMPATPRDDPLGFSDAKLPTAASLSDATRLVDIPQVSESMPPTPRKGNDDDDEASSAFAIRATRSASDISEVIEQRGLNRSSRRQNGLPLPYPDDAIDG